jgi:hypothetical protein
MERPDGNETWTGLERSAGTFWVAVALAQLAYDAHTVMTMRMLGMGGAWRLADNERDRMVREKAPALTEAMLGAFFLGLSGRQPEQIAAAYMQPFSDAARRNRARLEDNGPSRFGPAFALPNPKTEWSETR